jgi:hypothetical protein
MITRPQSHTTEGDSALRVSRFELVNMSVDVAQEEKQVTRTSVLNHIQHVMAIN